MQLEIPDERWLTQDEARLVGARQGVMRLLTSTCQ